MEKITKYFDMDGHRYRMDITKNEDASFKTYFFKSVEKIEDIKKEKGISCITMKRIENLDEFNPSEIIKINNL